MFRPRPKVRQMLNLLFWRHLSFDFIIFIIEVNRGHQDKCDFNSATLGLEMSFTIFNSILSLTLYIFFVHMKHTYTSILLGTTYLRNISSSVLNYERNSFHNAFKNLYEINNLRYLVYVKPWGQGYNIGPNQTLARSSALISTKSSKWRLSLM